MKYKRQNKGITLVALVITVVVMLILAGVAVAQFTGGDGIFSRVTDATREYKKQSMLEAVDLAKAYLEMEKTYKNEPITITDVIDKVKEISSINDEDYIITIDDEEQSATIIDKQTGVVIDIWIDENGEIQVEGSIVDDIENVVKPTITYTLDPPAGTYGDTVKITITATEEKNGIARMVLPDNSEITYNNEKTVTRDYIVTENGTYKFIVEGANGRETTKYVEVRNIKNAEAIVIEVQNTQPTKQNVNVKITYDENVEVGGQVLVNTDRFQYKIENGEWQIAPNAETTIQVGVNGTIYARYYDGNEGFGTVTAEVHNIDKIDPNAFNLSTTKTTNSITVNGSTIDTATAGCATENYGIAGYQFQLKNSAGNVITNWTATQANGSYTFSNLTQGETYLVSMRAVDKAGNMTEATNKDLSVTLNTVVDSSTAITSDYNPKTPTTENVQVTFTNNSGDSSLTLKYQKGSTTGTWTEYTGPVTMETNGTIYAKLFDNNNQSTNTATVTIQNIDRVAPNAFNLTTSKTTNSIIVSGSTTDTATAGCAAANYGVVGYQFQLKNSSGGILEDWTTTQTSGSYTFSNLTQGTTYLVSMRAVDKAGNMTEATNKDTSVTLNTVVDSSTAIGISYNPTTPTTGNVQVTFTNNSGQSGLTLKYQKDSTSGTWTEYTEPVEMTTNGTVYARLFDENEQYTKTATATVENIDRVAPVISSATASTSWGATNSVTITATDTGTAGCATKNIGIVGYGINQSNTTEPSYTTVAATTSLNTTVNVSANGTYYVWVKDQAGNTNNTAVTVNRIDTTAPTIATITSSNVEETTFTLTATGADGESGIAKYEFYLNGVLEETIETTEGTATYNVTGKTGGQSYKYKVRVYDKVGLYKESSEITVTTVAPIVEPEEVAQIGDFVNYSVVVDGVTYDKWRILDFDNNGHMEIVCYNGPSFKMEATDGYANAIKILNDESEPYGEGTYGYSTRHLGSDPSNPSSYATISTSYIKFYSDYSNISSNTNYRYINQTHHESDLSAIKSFSNTADGNKLADDSWLASRYVHANSSASFFNVRYVFGNDGRLQSHGLHYVYSDGHETTYRHSEALAPIVSLESGVKINTSTAGNGSEESPWMLTK